MATILFAQSPTISINSRYNTYSVGYFASANSLAELKTNVATAINSYDLYASSWTTELQNALSTGISWQQNLPEYPNGKIAAGQFNGGTLAASKYVAFFISYPSTLATGVNWYIFLAPNIGDCTLTDNNLYAYGYLGQDHGPVINCPEELNGWFVDELGDYYSREDVDQLRSYLLKIHKPYTVPWTDDLQSNFEDMANWQKANLTGPSGMVLNGSFTGGTDANTYYRTLLFCDHDSLVNGAKWRIYFTPSTGSCTLTEANLVMEGTFGAAPEPVKVNDIIKVYHFSPDYTLYYSVTSITEGKRTVTLQPENMVTPWVKSYPTIVPSGDLYIPDSISDMYGNKYYVSKIAEYAFQGTAVTSISVGAPKLCSHIFADCTNLTSAVMREGVKQIDYCCFKDCRNLTTVSLPASLSGWDSRGGSTANLFAGCTSLASIGLAEGNTTFDTVGGVLYSANHKTLYAYPLAKEWVGFEEGLEFIYSAALLGYKSFPDTLIIPASVVKATEGAVSNTNVKVLIIEGNIREDYSFGAFRDNTKLTDLYINADIEVLGGYMFRNCTALQRIFVRSSAMPDWNSGTDDNWPTFNSCFLTATVYVPCGMSDSYRALANKWANFTHIQDTMMYDLNINAVHGSVNVEFMSCNERRLNATPETGYAFHMWSDGNTNQHRIVTIDSDTTFTALFDEVISSASLTMDDDCVPVPAHRIIATNGKIEFPACMEEKSVSWRYDATGTLASGNHTYTLHIYAFPADGYKFDSSFDLTINGIAPSEIKTYQGYALDADFEFTTGPDTVDYLYFTGAEEGSSVTFKYANDYSIHNYEYSVDRLEWTKYTNQLTIDLDAVDTVFFRTGDDHNQVTEDIDVYSNFSFTGAVRAGGNIMSLVDPTAELDTLDKYAFAYLFDGAKELLTAPRLPATQISEYCYFHMFEGCKSLTKAPTLPAEKAPKGCYFDMFFDCIALREAPALPAMELGPNCYCFMFENCVALVTPPALPATQLAVSCYFCMFSGCQSLTSIPELAAVTMEMQCYSFMFENCLFNVEEVEDMTAPGQYLDLRTAVDAYDFSSLMFYGCGGTAGATPQVGHLYRITCPSAPTAIDENDNKNKNRKVIENGQTVIIKNGVKYNALGQIIK